MSDYTKIYLAYEGLEYLQYAKAFPTRILAEAFVSGFHIEDRKHFVIQEVPLFNKGIKNV